MILADALGAAYRALGLRFHTYPAHPALVRAFDRSPCYALRKQPGAFSPALGRTSGFRTSALVGREDNRWNMAGRPCAVFEYVGPAAAAEASRELIG
jgi:hypothetical protein